MNALRRIAAAPSLILLLWGAQLIVALVVGTFFDALVTMASFPFAGRDDGYVFGSVVELVSIHPSVGIGAALGLAIAALTSVVAWTLVAGLVIARLGRVERGERGSLWLRTLPGVVVTSLWHLLIRAMLLVIVWVSTAPLGWLPKALVFATVLAFSTLALDLARVQVVLHAASPFHLRTATNAYVQIVRQARRFAPALGPWFLQTCIVLASAWLALASLGGESHLWTVRGLALVGVVMGLWRLALVLEAGPVHLGATNDD